MVAAHKPGVIPLRPLRLGDIYDAAFKTIRFNPQATVGVALLVSAVCMSIPVIATAAFALVGDFGFATGLLAGDPSAATTPGGISDESLVAAIGTVGALLVGTLLLALGILLVTGMLAHVMAAAALGRKLTTGAAWRATRGCRWSLLGLALLLGLATTMLIAVPTLLVVVAFTFADIWVGVAVLLVILPVGVAALMTFWIRTYYLAVPILMLERSGVAGAISRSWSLTRAQFWRTFGIALLTLLMTVVASQVIGTPLAVVGQVGLAASGGTGAGFVIYMVSIALSQVVTTAFVTPFSASVATLQYLDQRIRKEAYDVELISQAGISAT